MSRILAKRSASPTPSAQPKRFRLLASSLYAFWKFSRPHTIVGTSLSVVGLYLMVWAMGNGQWAVGNGQWAMVHNSSLIPPPSSLILSFLACLCGNIYIVGLNQLADVEIDRINKPHLPLAAKEFTRKQATAIVVTAGVLAILLAIAGGPFLLAVVGLSLIIGTAYSLPPVRLKRFPFPASLCILTVRGVIVNLGLFLHFSRQRAIGDASSLIPHPSSLILPPLPPAILALTLFVLVFTLVIATFKDVPDIEGDRQYHISTFTLRVGQKTVFNLARGVLTACYLGIILAGIINLPGVNAPFLVTTHLLTLILMWCRSLSVNLQDKVSISRFYQFIWKLFFLEYLVFPSACWLN